MVEIREATTADVGEIVEIYNASILTTTTWSERLQTEAERAEWFEARRAAGDGALVATRRRRVVGFSAYGEFRNNELWPGYRFTVENSVHVAEGEQGRGVGHLLMDALIEHASRAGHHTMIAAVDGDNDGSIRFHERLGFVVMARLPQVGWKYGRWLDLVLMHRLLESPADERRTHRER